MAVHHASESPSDSAYPLRLAHTTARQHGEHKENKRRPNFIYMNDINIKIYSARKLYSNRWNKRQQQPWTERRYVCMRMEQIRWYSHSLGTIAMLILCCGPKVRWLFIQISQAMQCCLVLSIFDGLSRLSRLWVGLLIALGTLQSQAERTHHLYHRPDIACHCVEFSGLLVRQSEAEAENVAKREWMSRINEQRRAATHTEKEYL